MPDNSYSVQYFTDFSQLPARYASLIGVCEQAGLFWDAEWFALLMRHVFDDSDQFRIYSVEESAGGRPLLLAPLRCSTSDGAVSGGRVLGSVNYPENYAETALMFAPSVEDKTAVLTALFHHLKKGDAAADPPCDALRLWPVEERSELQQLVGTALNRAGFIVQAYENSYNRFEATAGIDYPTYFAQRSANLRYSVRRRQRALEKSGTLDLVLYTDEDDLEAALEDYVRVSLASWKSPPTMIGSLVLDLIRLAAKRGCLRLGILRLDGKAAAVQFWIVSKGTAHCARLAYDEAYKQLAVGVVLTNFMIAHVLDQDHVDKIDFGYGTEDYKGGWMQEARNYFGFMAFNPSTRLGLLHGSKHILGQPVKRAIKNTAKRAARLLRRIR